MIPEISQNSINTIFVFDYARVKELYLMIRDEVRKELEEEMAKSSTADTLIPRAEAEKLLGKSETTLWRWEGAGILHPYLVGNKVHYRKGDIDKILKGGVR